MCIAYKCDRCGDLYEYDYQRYLHSYFISKDCHPYEDQKMDLCPDCQDALVEWMTRVGKRESE